MNLLDETYQRVRFRSMSASGQTQSGFDHQLASEAATKLDNLKHELASALRSKERAKMETKRAESLLQVAERECEKLRSEIEIFKKERASGGT